MKKILERVISSIVRFFDKIIVEEAKRVDQFCRQYF